MKLGVIANLQRTGATDVVRRFVDWCNDRGMEMALCEELHSAIDDDSIIVKREDLPELSDLIVSMGGDGTLLATARIVGDTNVPILGVNIGSLGFLTVQKPDDLEDALDRIKDGRYRIEKRMALEAVVESSSDRKLMFALNEVVVGRSDFRMIKLALYSDGDYICSYAADGLIISTPTGSTAYSLAAGGPILNPEMNAIVASPIAPHSLASRPLIFTSQEKLRLLITSETDVALMTVDGQVSTRLRGGDKITVRRADHCVNLVRFDENSFYRVLRSKLHWGVLPVDDAFSDNEPQ
jgi:NAD+ kinase